MWLAFLSSNTTRVHYAVYIFSKVPTLGCVSRVVLGQLYNCVFQSGLFFVNLKYQVVEICNMMPILLPILQVEFETLRPFWKGLPRHCYLIDTP